MKLFCASLFVVTNSIDIDETVLTDGDNRKDREHDLKLMMKKLEAKYAALQIVPVISKLGTVEVMKKLKRHLTLTSSRRDRSD